jgi:hypothetical protein
MDRRINKPMFKISLMLVFMMKKARGKRQKAKGKRQKAKGKW